MFFSEFPKAFVDSIFVLVESVYSMDGDEAPLEELADECLRDGNAWLVVDEAHATGVIGKHGRQDAGEPPPLSKLASPDANANAGACPPRPPPPPPSTLRTGRERLVSFLLYWTHF